MIIILLNNTVFPLWQPLLYLICIVLSNTNWHSLKCVKKSLLFFLTNIGLFVKICLLNHKHIQYDILNTTYSDQEVNNILSWTDN